MLIKATRLHPGPLQSVIVGCIWVAVESVADIVFAEFAVGDNGTTVVEAPGVVGNVSAITEVTIWWIHFLLLLVHPLKHIAHRHLLPVP